MGSREKGRNAKPILYKIVQQMNLSMKSQFMSSIKLVNAAPLEGPYGGASVAWARFHRSRTVKAQPGSFAAGQTSLEKGPNLPVYLNPEQSKHRTSAPACYSGTRCPFVLRMFWL